MSKGSTPTGRRRRPIKTSEHSDLPPADTTCTKDGRPWHPLGEDGRAICPVCYPSVYAANHARHRYQTTEASAVTR